MATIDYPVRTSPLYWVVAAVLVLIGLFGLSTIGLTLLYGGPWTLTLLTAVLVALPPIYILGTPEYRARGQIRVGLDAVEVPGPGDQPLRFDPRTLQLHLTRVRVRYTIAMIPVADVQRGTVLELRDGHLHRRISTLTLVHPEHASALIDDRERVRRGEPPQGPQARPLDAPPPPPRPQSELERQLERELAALD